MILYYAWRHHTEALPDDVETLKMALTTALAAVKQAEAHVAGAQAMVAHLKLMIATLRRDLWHVCRAASFGAGTIGL